MAWSEVLQTHSEEAGSDLSSDQFKFVSVAADGQVDLTGAGVKTVGVLQDKPTAAGHDALVAHGGLTKIVAGAAIVVGVAITSDATGRAVTAVTGDIVHATAKEAAGAAGDVVTVQLHINGYIVPA